MTSSVMLHLIRAVLQVPDMEMPVQVALEDSVETADSKAVLTVVMVDREVDIRSIIRRWRHG